MNKLRKRPKIVVAMSGGVDSSVAAALLKKQGFDVVGIMMKFWRSPELAEGKDGENRCCSVESEKLARAVAKKIGIPFYVINVEKEFKKKVVDYFFAEYKKGNTPNPCVVCNKEIKFGFLIKKALSLGADFVATGHYARISLGDKLFSGREVPLLPFGQVDPNLQKAYRLAVKSVLPRLFAGADKEKDQSYFLWQLSQDQLRRVLFPVGGYTKTEVRKLAKKFKLPTAETPESQEVCFISQTTSEFLKKYLKTKPGDICLTPGVNETSTPGVVGKHNGLWFYTIGQRRGLEIPQGPYYVVDKDFKKNILIVSKNKKDLLKKEFTIGDVNWISDKKSKLPLKAKCKIRYKSQLADALIRANKGGEVEVVFKKSQKAITPGQSAVFYKGEELLGGATIDKTS